MRRGKTKINNLLCVLPPYLQNSPIETEQWWTEQLSRWGHQQNCYQFALNQAKRQSFTMGRRCNVLSTLLGKVKFAKSDFRQKYKKKNWYVNYVQILRTTLLYVEQRTSRIYNFFILLNFFISRIYVRIWHLRRIYTVSS